MQLFECTLFKLLEVINAVEFWTKSYNTTLVVCMYVSMSKNLYPARLKQKVTVAPRSQTETSVDKSAERREDGRLFQILVAATVKL